MNKTKKEVANVRRLYSNGEITLNRAREELGLEIIWNGDIRISPINTEEGRKNLVHRAEN